MQTQGQNASSLWGGSSNLNGLDSNWGGLGNQNSAGANFGLGLGTTNSLSSNSGHNMQSGASSSFGESLNTMSTNALLGNSSRMNFGAPGTLAPGHSAMKPSASGGNMQGSLSASGAQTNGPQSNQSGLSGASSQLAGLPASSQGNSAFGGSMGFQKTPIGSGSGPGMAPGAGSNAQNSDNLSASGWGMPSSSTNNSTLTGTSSWLGNPSSSADWDQQSTNMSQSQQQITQSSNPQFRTANPGQPPATDNQRPSSWAQAAGKGLNLHSNNPAAGAAGNVKSPAELQREAEIRKAIESHDGWGKKPIRQDTEWSIEASPKVQNKFSTQSVVPDQPQQQKATNNMWNNNNGTAIWEANKDAAPWNNNAVTRPVPGQTPANWSGPPQNMPNPAGNQWAGGPSGQNQISDKTIGSWGTTPDGGQPSGSNWSSSTEVGSWGGNTQSSQNSTASGGITTWGEDGGSGWGEGQSRAVGGNGTAYWGDPPGSSGTQHQQQWGMGPGQSQPTAIGQRKPETKPPSGWGEISGPPDSKIDDGTGLWSSNNQQSSNSSNWDGSNQQWAVGKPRPNLQHNPAAYGGVDDLHWNTPQEDIWSEESMKGWDDADMGTWNDSTLENNSTWNSATGFNKNLRRNSLKGPTGAIKLPGATPGGHPQMRSRLLQQLMDLGFKKEDAQGALINNNMNIQSALSDLYNRQGAGRKDGTMDMFQVDGNKPRIPGLQDDDISDTPTDSNSFVPNLNMQNTPYNNAQSQIPNQFPFNKSSLPQPSRNNPNTSINMLQNKIIQKIHNQQPPPPTPSSMNSINQSQGPLGRGQLPGNQNMQQQQMAQQQILQQLQMAVQAGLISPALLNQQLPPGVLVMLQQLLQLQQVLQQLITAQQNLPQNKAGINPLVQRQQQENLARISAIRQQILSLQKKIAQAQKMILNNPDKPQPDNSMDQSDSLVNKLSPDFGKLSVSTSQPTSRLTQWKMPSEKESPDDQHSDPGTSETPTTTGDDSSSLNKAVGSKPMQQSQSTPNLRQNYNELGLNNLGGDSTWSATPTSSSASLNWPSTSTPSSTASQGDGVIPENKESQPTISASATSASDNLPAMSSIPEFVPGKPWLGLAKNPEDDPHITPGSLQRALSVSMVKDDYLTSLTKSSPTNDTTSTWPNSKPLSSTQNLAHKPWSPGSDVSAGSSLTSDVWGLPKGGMSRPPPGLPQHQQRGSTGWTAVGRQHSWAGPPSRSDLSIGSINVSTSLVLKNLTPQIDGSVLRTLCMQHGPLQCFFVNTAQGQALVKYSSKDEAMKAQNSLNNCPLGNTTIMAEFVSDNDAMRFVEQQNAISAPSHWPPSAHIGGNRQSAFGLPSHRNEDVGNWNVSSMGSSGSSMWGSDSGMRGGDSTGAGNLWGMDDPHSVLGNIYG